MFGRYHGIPFKCAKNADAAEKKNGTRQNDSNLKLTCFRKR